MTNSDPVSLTKFHVDLQRGQGVEFLCQISCFHSVMEAKLPTLLGKHYRAVRETVQRHLR